jgi:hypothetical protein
LTHLLIQSPLNETKPLEVASPPEKAIPTTNPSSTEGIATKDIYINPSTVFSLL